MADNGKDITIYDIAKKLDISAATVSRGLQDHPRVNKNTKKLIRKTAEEMGYHFNSFASNLRKKKSKVIGVIVPRLNSNFMSDVIAGIEKVVNNANYGLFISQSLETMQREISNADAMLNNRVEGLLVSLAYNTTDVDHFREFIRRKTPVIFFDRVTELENCPLIHIDNFKAAYEITLHLIDQGCKRIVHITGNLLRNVYKDRFDGYKKALEDRGIPFDDSLVIVNDLSAAAGTVAAQQILQMTPLPDGVFSSNDICAIACMLAVKQAGIKIPQQLAFAGFNNDPTCCVVEPNLTTVNYKGYEMGEVAAKMMINYLTDKDSVQPAHSVILRSELLVRESSLRK
ncbi:LacI family DNA-binding transcriptional regulator [Mucilaginibacter sabulilitoris]|uniref:LacI family DNA-binding transcriptional regulator n=1 Tax=Mucilaginibacter sabulilitoris TaxID=1173583 RepID=A0ABZ0TQ20_9SPHI|nr:LacI family DNA-binding transcriptional regulator [Mucilaginibacter sabulilitoris]WPU95249.1 LacI family DNA-binding transcriptional regulator [Mucilaginibacter sabulilitoris]